MLGKLFNSKKEEYFLEFDEAKDKQAPQPESKPAPEPQTKAEKSAKTKTPSAPSAQPQTTTVVPPQPKPAPAKEPAPLNPGQVKTPAGMTFAPDNLMPNSSTPRRGPGPSMAMFTNMAGQMNRS
ncbi:hypothetical protein [Planktothrix sp. FACHB-1365]|uniref:hypothetical protein n=1 Tax=Planktothrix sp. FACHB-1365 TaxID=2692855 RepID=UPI00168947C7|nr:hypothetical protein [Planktothrix sp. FACHB-1365]MBD2485112.1 hypothetical protein [Planktothrix sp. FACHB-1365]